MKKENINKRLKLRKMRVEKSSYFSNEINRYDILKDRVSNFVKKVKEFVSLLIPF